MSDAANASIHSKYTLENYDAYCEMFRSDPAYKGLIPSGYGHWVAFNETMDRIARDESLQRVIGNPMMADDYNPETGECDGIKYWERNAD